MAGVVMMTAVAIAGFAIAIYAAWLFHDLPDGNEIVDYRPPTSTRVFAWDGTLIGEFAKERRVFIPYNRIPDRLGKAFLAAEDRNFFNHSGVDVGGLSRAMMKNVVNFVQGRRLEGGSTITQQVAKNVLLTNERTLGRKLKEFILARRLETSLSKEQILELYLNDIYLGYRSNGIGTAAYNYFGKSVDQLTLAEMAYLAALPKGPNQYHPTRYKERAIERRNWILGEMAKVGWVTPAEAEAAMKEDLVVQAAPQRAKYRDADFFVAEVESRAKNLFGDDIYSSGYYLKTTLDPKLQTAARIALMDGLELYDRRHGWRGAWGNIPLTEGWQDDAVQAENHLPERKRAPFERPDWQIAIVERASGAIRLAESTTNENRGQIRGADVAWTAGNLKAGDLVYVSRDATGTYHLHQVPAVNGALVAVDPWTGRVVAMVGGYSYSLSKFNRATQAKRQPGSAIKPFIYATALEADFTPASIVMDSPITFRGANGESWSPKNYSRTYYGPQTLRKGLELSRNAMTVRLADKVGMKTVAAKVVQYGAVDKMEPYLSNALGSTETTPYQLTAAYSAFVNGGRRIKPHLIEMVQDYQGKVIYRADQRNCPNACKRAFDGTESPRLTPDGQPVMDPIVAYQINSYLQGVVQRGTAVKAQVLGRPVGGKTGTTNEYRSAWFVGFTPDLVVGVFVGYDDNRSLGDSETGGSSALPIFVDFMMSANKNKPVKEFRKPKDAVFVSIRGHEEAFRPGTEPKPVERVPGEVDGPKPYNEVWRDGLTGQPADEVPVQKQPTEQPKKKKYVDEIEEEVLY
ncbi:penicillin-binding protein 1A [Asticcacaulis sp. BYS171W]|uniref:Penicillin-binding protein 1A n=1 Tax=Asticcacaulis aquaticus TaxID=2984212 RepID=A0ABT5HNY3_9CAUL|nr:penicillin-binding protein 1A [Asticcacaulis aquaticus]MDC7681699.1 penicillin-binding protein 1A [Asticcacaulis aquaticus]